ncbi:MAG: hypothetical protein J6K96_09495 [Treponema sp.]|nr:hypothetical protein [Treponema sp.]
MPGLKQLQQFNSDILNLGDEVKIRAARGEKPVTIAIPKDASQADDSEDFIGGLPVTQPEEQPGAQQEQSEADFASFFGGGTSEAEKAPEAALEEPIADVPDFLPSADDLDLSEFESAPEIKAEDTPKENEISIEDMDLDSLLAPGGGQEEADGAHSQPENAETDTSVSPADDFSFPDENAGQASGISEPDGASFDPALFDLPQENESGVSDGLPEFDADAFSKTLGASQSETEEQPLDDVLPDFPDGAGADAGNNLNLDDLDLPDFGNTASAPGADSASSGSAGDDLNLDDLDLPDLGSTASEPGTDSASSGSAGDDLNLDDLDLPDFGSTASAPGTDSASSGSAGDDLNLDDLDLPNLDSTVSSETESGTGEPSGSSSQEDSGGLDIETLSPELEVPEEEAPAELFDTSEISGLDFSNQENDDFALGSVDSFEGDDEFHIPGFSDTETASLNKKPEADASEPSAAEKPKNTFTDAEYKKFQKNLASYPLNVRIALEDFVVKNEFTDDAIFSVLEKVLKKAPARQVAAELEKLLDISLYVPRDFERRSAAEYEAYKKSVEYQLKNRIIPGAILTAASAILIFCIFTLTNNFVYKPMRAHSLYRQGYALLEDSQYPQSEERFNQALTYKPVKKWFFRYAQGYRSHRQYGRAGMMYRALLQRYNHDKKAGLDWADMELYDLYNYAESERILKREVLDYHINDPEAILALGDLYLEWATDKDPEKFPLAKEQYDLLAELYGQNSLYLSRQMRYFIRTDDLRQVLIYREFFKNQKKPLPPKDQIELSGYMLDKRYGKLRPSEESLRSSIEDVRKLLESALASAPSDAIALYNMGRYFVETSSGRNAAKMLEASVRSFEQQTKRSRRDTYKYINAYRLLGEEKRDEREYLTAEELYGKGIALFEGERESSGFESDENVGKLYADLADLDYFISGDTDAALANYESAVNNKHDTSSVRYRIGYIQYQKRNYPAALGSFIRSQDTNESDTHLLLALANTLSLSSDNYVARGYYERLLSLLAVEREKYGIVLPQLRDDHADIVDTYMKASNNLGVTLARIARATGDSSLNAQSIVSLQESLRAWDAMTRNQETMIRLDGSNLAEQNIKYITHPVSGYEPEIYTEIPRLLYGEEGLQ